MAHFIKIETLMRNVEQVSDEYLDDKTIPQMLSLADSFDGKKELIYRHALTAIDNLGLSAEQLKDQGGLVGLIMNQYKAEQPETFGDVKSWNQFLSIKKQQPANWTDAMERVYRQINKFTSWASQIKQIDARNAANAEYQAKLQEHVKGVVADFQAKNPEATVEAIEEATKKAANEFKAAQSKFGKEKRVPRQTKGEKGVDVSQETLNNIAAVRTDMLIVALMKASEAWKESGKARKLLEALSEVSNAQMGATKGEAGAVHDIKQPEGGEERAAVNA